MNDPARVELSRTAAPLATAFPSPHTVRPYPVSRDPVSRDPVGHDPVGPEDHPVRNKGYHVFHERRAKS